MCLCTPEDFYDIMRKWFNCRRLLEEHWFLSFGHQERTQDGLCTYMSFKLSTIEWQWLSLFRSFSHVCSFGMELRKITDFHPKNIYLINYQIIWSDQNTIYCTTCTPCNMRWIAQTSRSLRRRISEPINNIKTGRPTRVSNHWFRCGRYLSIVHLSRGRLRNLNH